ncbi:unnamed protein product [Linum trigynum]|uniref:Uncharacterized protein n=1 Tax=Linum trigynum TaxID=586398 RepID=A0AAV2GT12_9ROSI
MRKKKQNLPVAAIMRAKDPIAKIMLETESLKEEETSINEILRTEEKINVSKLLKTIMVQLNVTLQAQFDQINRHLDELKTSTSNPFLTERVAEYVPNLEGNRV